MTKNLFLRRLIFKIKILNFINKNIEILFEGHLEVIRKMIITNDQNFIISSSDDKTVRF
jgi:WD domain, G-beta repeat.